MRYMWFWAAFYPPVFLICIFLEINFLIKYVHIHDGHVLSLAEKAFGLIGLINKKYYQLLQLMFLERKKKLVPEVPSFTLSLDACWDVQVNELQSVAPALTKEKS